MILELADGSSALVRGAAALLLGLHVTSGIVGIASGAVGLVVRKGSATHRKAGVLFLASMLTMATIGTLVSPFLPRPNWSNLIGGLYTLYLLATAWAAARRRDGRARRLEVGALLVALGIAGLAVTLGLAAARSPTGSLDGTPLPAYFVFGAAAALAAAGDLRWVARRQLTDAQRLTRHLWRMGVALLIAVASLFLGQPRVFPAALRGSMLLLAPEVAVGSAILYWLVRVRVGGRGTVPTARGLAAQPRERRPRPAASVGA